MIPSKPAGQRLTFLAILFFAYSSINNVSAQDGQTLFMSKCASCHKMDQKLIGPPLKGVLDNWGGDEKALKLWIKDWQSAVKAGIPRAVEIQNYDPSQMQVFSAVPDKDIDAIYDYITKWQPPAPPDQNSPTAQKGSNNAVIFGIISLILAIIALILLQVNSNLKKMSDDAEGIQRPEPVAFYRNKVYIAMLALLAFVVAGYFVAKGAIGLGRQKDYQPHQPIFYSHKVHAGLNQINCLYCHGSAWESKTAGIPSVNICMNCHKGINEYKKGPELYTEEGKKIDGTAEIAKLYNAAGFDPANANKWDPSKAKPLEWIKIHNLPDHVYFNHAQHTRVGKVQCQTCHGEITAMDEVKQVAELSMGWCVNCHRQTKVDFNYSDSTGNKFYSIYEKFHNDLKTSELQAIQRDTTLKPAVKRFKIDSVMKLRSMKDVRVKDIGGLECQKCHY